MEPWMWLWGKKQLSMHVCVFSYMHRWEEWVTGPVTFEVQVPMLHPWDAGCGAGGWGPLHSTQLQGVLCPGLPFLLWIAAFTASPCWLLGEWASSGHWAHCIGGDIMFEEQRHQGWRMRILGDWEEHRCFSTSKQTSNLQSPASELKCTSPACPQQVAGEVIRRGPCIAAILFFCLAGFVYV